MRIKLEPLMAIINYYNNFQPLYISQSLYCQNAIWVCEYCKYDKKSGDFLVYSLDKQEILNISAQWKEFLEQVSGKSHQLYFYFEQDMENFMKRFPHETWFLPEHELVQGELVV